MDILRGLSLLCLILTICLVNQSSQYFGDDFSCPNSDPEPWSPDWMTGDDLVCRCQVKDTGPNEEQLEDFCTCNAYPRWSGQEKSLDIEYITVMGKTLVIPDTARNTSDVYKIRHSSDEMTEIPSNLCNWDTNSSARETYKDIFKEFEVFWKQIVSIDFSWSNIKTLRNINCLERLYSLDLNRNKITHISNTSFHNLTQLRRVDFSSNYIATIDPAVTSAESLQLMVADLSYNNMNLIDISNMYSKHPFCSLRYNNNNIKEIVNSLKVELDISFGPGFVDLEDNKIETFPDFKEILGIEDLSEIGKMISFGFDLRGIPLICDCNLQPFRSLSDDIFKSLWRDYFNVTCTEPEHHAGKLAFHVPKEELICPIEVNENTTIGCSYKDIPENKTLFVNCSRAGLTKLPATMPYSKFSEYIDLDISHNNIKNIDNVTYLTKLSRLDISNNNLNILEHETGILLENATYINISNNPELREIPQIFQYHNSCSINFEHNIFICDCDTRWFISWLKDRQCGNKTLFQCEVEGYGTMQATDFKETMIECESENTILLQFTISLSVVMALLILTATLVYMYRYELLILLLRSRRTGSNQVLPQHPYDVYIAFDEENDVCRKWVKFTLVPELEKAGYKVFLPIRDLKLGEVKAHEVIQKCNESRRYLFILSDSYLKKDDEESEWKYAWGLMKRDRMKKIVIVNYDFISSFDVLHPQIRAYLRVGNTVTFDNWDRDIIPRIMQQLDPPYRPKEQKRHLPSAKKVVSVIDIFTTEKIDDTDIDWEEVHNFETSHSMDITKDIQLGYVIPVSGKKKTTQS